MSVVVDTNVLIELFLPTQNAQAVQDLWTGETEWWLPALWICASRHLHLKFLRAGRLDLNTALNNLSDAEKTFLPQTVAVDSAEALRLAAQHGFSSYEAEFIVLALQLAYPLLTFDQKVLQLFPNLAVRSVAELRRVRHRHQLQGIIMRWFRGEGEPGPDWRGRPAQDGWDCLESDAPGSRLSPSDQDAVRQGCRDPD